MLKMLELTRDMIGRINLPTIMNSITGLSNTNGGKVTGLEQQVHITAEFPNVEKASEVENALKNLVNIASQRANIK